MLARLLLFITGVFLAPGFVKADDRISIDARINGERVALAFDTGSGEGFVLWRATAQRLKLALDEPPPGTEIAPGEMLAARTGPLLLEILGQPVPDVRFAVLEPPSYLPMDIHGLIGWPAVRGNILFLQLQDGVVRPMPTIPADTAAWMELPMRSDKDQLILTLPARSGAARGSGILIDTGMEDGVHVSPEVWSAWRRRSPRAPVTMHAYYSPVAGLVVREKGWADEIDLGGLVLRGVSVAEANPGEAALVGPDFAGTLGLAALRRFDIVIDGPGGRARLKPRQESPGPVVHNRLGAVFAPPEENASDLVARVARSSPAAAARIRDGDVLLKIDELDVTQWRTQPGILPLARFWEKPAGSRLLLTLRRGDRTITTSVTLRDIIGPRPAR